MRLLEKAHIPQLIGEEYITVRVNDAVLLCKVHLPVTISERSCIRQRDYGVSLPDTGFCVAYTRAHHLRA